MTKLPTKQLQHQAGGTSRDQLSGRGKDGDAPMYPCAGAYEGRRGGVNEEMISSAGQSFTFPFQDESGAL